MILPGSAYSNGNYFVTRRGRGDSLIKRCFRVNEDFVPDFPDSIDLKISDRCSIGCPFCHEKSTSGGRIGYLDEIKNHLSSLPEKAIEIAIGGGNLLEDDETLKLLRDLVIWFHGRGNKVNITLSEKTITKENLEKLRDIKPTTEMGIGISLGPDITEERLRALTKMMDVWLEWDYKNIIVYHVILGLIPIPILKILLNDITVLPLSKISRVLFLGYKQYGRARNTNLPESLPIFETLIKKSIIEGRELSDNVFFKKILGFDNLAISQLNLSGSLLDSEFNDIFLGPDFSCSMYVDAVRGEYAKNSVSDERVSWDDIDIIDYFKHDKN